VFEPNVMQGDQSAERGMKLFAETVTEFIVMLIEN
jgi:hypothetical protein